MKTALPAWQLTTSELAREIHALEASPDDGPPGGGDRADGRLGTLYDERAERERLSTRLAVTAGQFSDDEPW